MIPILDPTTRALATTVCALVIIEALVWIGEYFGWIRSGDDYWRGP